jgi:hypothetical protein
MATSERQGYRLAEIPARGDGRSRFLLDTSPGGHPTPPVTNLALAAKMLLNERMAEAKAVTPPAQREGVKMVAYRGGEGYVIADRGVVEAIPVVENRRSGKLTGDRFRKDCGDTLDRFLLGDPDVFDVCTDADVWHCLREVVEAEGIEPASLRRLNDAVAQLLLLRAGLVIAEDQLPHPAGGMVS